MNPKVAELLKYGSPLHRKVSDALKARLRMSESKMKDRYAKIAQNEELFQAFIPERDVDALRRQNREQDGVPEYRTIELPYAYASAMTAHTYYTSVFLSRSPVLQLSTRHGEPEQSRAAVEALLAYQVNIGMMMLQMFVWLLDPAKAGYGVLMTHWDKEMSRVRQSVDEPVTFMGIPIPDLKTGLPKTRKVDKVEDVVGYEGNRAVNVRPQDFFPDPRVALIHFQKGEFCGRYVETAWNEIYRGQQSGRYFNYDSLKQLRSKGDKDNQVGYPTRDQGGRTTVLPGEVGVEDAYNVPVGFIRGHEVFLKLVPGEWKLADSDQEEIWAFNIAVNGVVFGATPLGEYHNKFPFDLITDEVDGYSIFPASTLERIKPLSDVMSWLINTHFYNVRATLNNQLVVDPSMVVMKDVENPEPGKIIRLKPQAYGKGVDQALKQLQMMDVTRTHIGDLPMVMNFLERMTGASDSMMGMSSGGGDRKTATEVRTSTTFGSSRLKSQCEWFSITGFAPLTQKLVQRTQQFYTAQKQFRLVGDLAQFSPTFALVRPEDIAGFYDYEPVDGTLPVDRFAQATLWQQILQALPNFPQVMMQYDITKIFAWVAQLAGIKNMTQFKLVPNEVALENARRGNVVPLAEAGRNANLPAANTTGQMPGVGSVK